MPIGPISKLHAHMPGVREHICHYSTGAMMYNSKLDKWGVQKKKAKAYDHEKWAIGVSGHNTFYFGEGGKGFDSFEETLVREAEEEIGLQVCIYDEGEVGEPQGAHGQIFQHFHSNHGPNNEYIGLGIIVTEQEVFDFPDGEVTDFVWVSDDEIDEFIQNNVCSEALSVALDYARKYKQQSDGFTHLNSDATDDFEDRLMGYGMSNDWKVDEDEEVITLDELFEKINADEGK